MNKFLRNAFFVLLITLFFSSCGEQDEKRIVIWTNCSEFAQYVELFNNTHPDKTAIVVPLDNHRGAAFFADEISLLRFKFDIPHICIRFFKRFCKRTIEISKCLTPRLLAGGDCLKFIFHIFCIFNSNRFPTRACFQ